ncbi:NmrA family NAD(P)-binding protein [Pararhizobium sp. IMCC21322]|uniref:NmrA family NAD(P)-binding protein n=1 Tax=Pararhizobium sp. IMCC21322 TaxID=3067903 RepID=UPI0027411F6E|nr:NmrA family NAD(P)-binding protein [Pararhizobium sp. IMCC21322]
MQTFREKKKPIDKNELYVVTGVSGRTGSAAAHALLKAGKRVRVVVRDDSKGGLWASQGAEVVLADFTDLLALSSALSGGDRAYIISPPQYDSNDLFEQSEVMAHNIAEAVANAQLKKVVALSSIGADKSDGTGWIAMNRTLEKFLGQTGLPVTFLRAAYFMENWSPLVQAATHGELRSFLAPVEQKLPMISTKDIGRMAAAALCEDWYKVRIIELEGPARYSPKDVANSLTQALEKIVVPIALSESAWPEALSNAGFSTVAVNGFVEMTQGLNSGHISFINDAGIDHRTGIVSLDTAIATMVA